MGGSHVRQKQTQGAGSREGHEAGGGGGGAASMLRDREGARCPSPRSAAAFSSAALASICRSCRPVERVVWGRENQTEGGIRQQPTKYGLTPPPHARDASRLIQNTHTPPPSAHHGAVAEADGDIVVVGQAS